MTKSKVQKETKFVKYWMDREGGEICNAFSNLFLYVNKDCKQKRAANKENSLQTASLRTGRKKKGREWEKLPSWTGIVRQC